MSRDTMEKVCQFSNLRDLGRGEDTPWSLESIRLAPWDMVRELLCKTTREILSIQNSIDCGCCLSTLAGLSDWLASGIVQGP